MNVYLRVTVFMLFFMFLEGCAETKAKPINELSNDKVVVAKKVETIIDSVEIDLIEFHEDQLDLHVEIESFVSMVLDGEQRLYSKEYFENSKVRHVELFEKAGLVDYYAYSDKRLLGERLATYYENFTLFVFEYKDERSAANSIKKLNKISNREIVAYSKLEGEEKILVNNLETTLKPGSFVCQRNNLVVSLVKHCSPPEFTKTWKEYEDLLIDVVAIEGETINTLSARCGMMRYVFEKRSGKK